MAIVTDELIDALSDVESPILKQRGESNGKVGKASAQEILKNYRGVVPIAVAKKLGAKEATGDRSRVLWRLERSLLEAGLSAGEVVVLLERTVWNKFADDRSRLWADVNKAAASVKPRRTGSDEDDQPRHEASSNGDRRKQPWSTPVEKYLAIESKDPQWMIEGLWTDRSHGIVAGEPKTRKSYLALDLALSVATGTKAFNHFEVKRAGAVLMVQEEISDGEMKKRLRVIAEAKQLGGSIEHGPDGLSVHMPKPIPLYLRNRQGFDLTDVEHMQRLQVELEAKKIRLLILDPLQMMLGQANENQTHEVRPILRNLLLLKEATGCGILIVHHYHKSNDKNPRIGGQRMSGSHAFHGWVESALYLSKPEPMVTEVEREFRNFDPQPTFTVEYIRSEGYEVSVDEKRSRKDQPHTDFEKKVLKHLNVSVKAWARHMKVSDNTVRQWVKKSPYLELRKLQSESTGRPRDVVGRARVE